MVWMHGRIKCGFGYLQKVVRLGRCCHRCWAWGRLNHVGAERSLRITMGVGKKWKDS
ncbi:hypothetical protein Hanom_Chr11g01052901 [Helianthus anomalus]